MSRYILKVNSSVKFLDKNSELLFYREFNRRFNQLQNLEFDCDVRVKKVLKKATVIIKPIEFIENYLIFESVYYDKLSNSEIPNIEIKAVEYFFDLSERVERTVETELELVLKEFYYVLTEPIEVKLIETSEGIEIFERFICTDKSTKIGHGSIFNYN